MSYFTDDSPYKSSAAPLVVDNNNLPAPELGFIEQNIQTFKNESATGLSASETKNIADQLSERAQFLEGELGPDFESKLSDFGYERGVMGPAGDPWLSTGRNDGFESALEAYRETLSGDKKAKLLVGDEVESAAKERAKRIEAETSKKLERTKYGWWAGLPGIVGAHLTDPFEVFALTLAPAATPARLIAAAGRAGLAGRVGLRAGVESAAGFAYEAPAQFGQIKPYKNELGIPYTNRDAANAVFAATIFSGVFGGVFEFGAAAFRKVKTGEWTPEQAQKHIAENYNKLPPEEQEMADIALGLMERERLNPYGPTEEGRKKFNKEFTEAEQHAHSTGRRVTEEDVIKAQELAEPRDLEQELAELREAAVRDAGLEQQADEFVDDIEAPEVPQAPLDQFEPVLRAFSDNFEIGDDFSSGFLRRMGIDRSQIDDFIEYAREQGYLSEKGDKMKVTRRSEALPEEDPDAKYNQAQQERWKAVKSLMEAKEAYRKAIDDNDPLKIKETRKQVMKATTARNKAREVADFSLPDNLQAIADRIIPDDVRVKMADSLKLNKFTRSQAADLTSTPEFKNWFKGSKVVDDEGNPLVVYHGTNAKIGQEFAFDKGRLGQNYNLEEPGFFFTDDKRSAGYYSLSKEEEALGSEFRRSKEGRQAMGERVVPVYLKLNNPLTLKELSSHSDYIDVYYAVDAVDSNRSIINEMLATGKYDGLYIKKHGEKVFAVTEPNQIKSVNNKGTFDPNDPRILYQTDGANAQGAYFPEEKLIQISRAALDPEGTARHEAMEALNDLGYFKKEEWDMLEASAIEGDWISKHNIEQRYKDIYDGESQRGDMLREAINEEYAAWARGETEVTPALKKLFERVKQVLNEVATILRKQGINDYRDIFKMVESGELKNRGSDVDLKPEPESQPLIDIDGAQMTPEELIRAADNDIAMAENIALCARLGG